MATLKRVKDYMDENVVTIEPEASATDAAKLMLENKIGSLIVKKDAIYYGILTEGDISRKVTALELVHNEVPVKNIMSDEILTIDGRSTMRKAFLEMNKRKIRHIAVTENGRYIGILSIKDFANYYSNRIVKQTK
ncbi:MAG: CBS domain-containing protein [Nitrospina sp.]|jgi:signal-transduction protein with cAMP-binding, CBS, and nucleotidyltransferase domain|nr:CBS domain-containing protein [Nitrospina sp.]